MKPCLPYVRHANFYARECGSLDTVLPSVKIHVNKKRTAELGGSAYYFGWIYHEKIPSPH